MFTRILFVISLLFLVNFSALYAQEAEEGTFHYIVEKAKRNVDRIESQFENARILKVELDLAQDDNFTAINLEAGKEYVFVCFGDERIDELSMILYDKDKKGKLHELLKDNEATEMAHIRFSPETTSTYSIDVRINRLKDEHKKGHFGLIVCELR